MNQIITINRQFGSGGREVGKRLADTLNIAYYDREIIGMIADETNLSPTYISSFEEHFQRQYPITFGRTFSMPTLTPKDKLQITQSKMIKQIAKQHSCVIVGRCANDILRDSAFKVFVFSSDMEKRIQRCYDKVPADKDKSKEEMQKMILSVDKQRAKYNQHYTGANWMDISNYNLCIDTAKVDIRKAVELIVAVVK